MRLPTVGPSIEMGGALLDPVVVPDVDLVNRHAYNFV